MPDQVTNQPIDTNQPLNKNGQPFFVRKGELIGGGFWIFRRGKRAGRVKPGPFPFEHPDLQSAATELARLQKKFPKETFVIVHQHPMPIVE